LCTASIFCCVGYWFTFSSCTVVGLHYINSNQHPLPFPLGCYIPCNIPIRLMSGSSSSAPTISRGEAKLLQVQEIQRLAQQERTDALISEYEQRAAKLSAKDPVSEAPSRGALIIEPVTPPSEPESTFILQASTAIVPILHGCWSARIFREGELAWSREAGNGDCEWLHALESSPGNWTFHHNVERAHDCPE
jgi:hypothetical protein